VLIRILFFSGIVPKKKHLKVRTKLRTASKVQEKQLLSTAKWLAKNPEAVIPRSEEQSRKCDFSKLAIRINRVTDYFDDAGALGKLSKRGDPLVRAYAATLLLAVKDKARYLRVARGPDGEIAYMHPPEAKVQKEKLLGLQYFRDPRLRLLAYGDIARKRKVVIYSTRDALLCSESGARPPESFIEETLKRLPVSRKDGSTWICPHSGDNKGYLDIFWKNAEIHIHICDDCLEGGVNTVSIIAQRMIDPSIHETFSVRARIRLESVAECDICTSDNMYEFHSNDLNRYINGEIPDNELYDIATGKYLDSLKESSERHLIIGMRCFGKDEESFVNALATDDIERGAVGFVVNRIEGAIVLPEGITTNKFLGMYWEQFGKELISELAGGDTGMKLPEISERNTPMSIIEGMMAKKRIAAVEDSLPRYEQLEKFGSFVDKVVRKYKSRGREAALRDLELTGTEHTRQRSIGLAMIIALGEPGKEWQYTKEEIEYARHLSPIASSLLKAEGEEYDSHLREFLSNAGVSEKLVRRK